MEISLYSHVSERYGLTSDEDHSSIKITDLIFD